jgi:hypothetical protein
MGCYGLLAVCCANTQAPIMVGYLSPVISYWSFDIHPFSDLTSKTVPVI